MAGMDNISAGGSVNLKENGIITMEASNKERGKHFVDQFAF